MNNNYIEVLTIDMDAWDNMATYRKGEEDLYNTFTVLMDFNESEAFLNRIAEKAYEDADETGTDEMRYYCIVERYGWEEGRQYWQDIHTELYRVDDTRGAA